MSFAEALRGGSPPGLGLVAFCLLTPRFVVAQSGSLSLDAGFSYSLPPASVTAESTPYLFVGTRLGVPLGDSGSWSLFGAGGLSLESTGSSWLSLSTSFDSAIPMSASLFLDLSLRGEVFSVGDPNPYRAAVAEAEPALRLEAGASTIRLVGRGGIGRSEVPLADRSSIGEARGGGSLRPAPDVVSDLWSWGGRFEYYYRKGAFEPRLRLEAYAAPQGDYVGGGAGVRFTALGGLWDADIGLSRAPSGTEFQFGISLFLPFGPDLALRSNAGRYGPDPLLGTPAAGSAAAIASWTITRFAAPAPALYRIQPGSPSLVTFRLASAEASRVEITGGFTDWEPRPMQRVDEAWVLTLPFEPGVYHFGFLVNGEWYVPVEADGRIIDAWGVEQATLVVPES